MEEMAREVEKVIGSGENAPQWMSELEDRLLHMYHRQRLLGHEVGAGSPCLRCRDTCPGLQLHFWRKICSHCKCPKEDHDVPVDDKHLVLDALLGKVEHQGYTIQELKLKAKSRNAILDQSDEGDLTRPNKTMPFSWIPPNISTEMASEYMEQLPSDKMPVCGSFGDKYRRQQLIKQIPIHDITPEYNFLTFPEKVCHTSYLNDLRKTAVGQGKIIRICLKQFKEESIPCSNLPKPAYSRNLKPDLIKSEERPKSPFDQTIANTINNMQNLMMSPYGKFGPGNEKPSPNTAFRNLPESIPTSVLKVPPAFMNKNEPPKTLNENADAFLADLPDPNDDEDDDLALSGVHELSPETSGEEDLSAEALQLIYQEKKDNASQSEGTSQISQPNQQSTRKSLTFGSNAVKNDEVNTTNRDESNVILVDKKLDCHECKKPVDIGSVAVVATRAGRNVAWHPQCFVCNLCKELLVDLVYFFYKGEVFCGRHYAEKNNIPRCFGCDELIFTNEFTLADDKSYHVFHFCCFECNTELANKEYLFAKGLTVCVPCFEEKYAATCQGCKGIIKPTEIGMQFHKIHWHEHCFKCHVCAKPVYKTRFTLQRNNPYCSDECVYRSSE